MMTLLDLLSTYSSNQAYEVTYHGEVVIKKTSKHEVVLQDDPATKARHGKFFPYIVEKIHIREDYCLCIEIYSQEDWERLARENY